MIDALRDLLQLDYNLNPATQSKLLTSLIIILVLAIVRLLALRFIHRQFRENPRALYNWRKVTEYTTATLGILLVGRIWVEGIQSLATYLGLLSAGLAIALQDLIINLAGLVFIVSQRPFQVGDRIEITGHSGDVIDIRLFQFSLLEIGNRIDAEQSTGLIIHIPNGKIFTESLLNHSQGLPYIWHEIPVLVTFESDWEKAKKILVDVISKHAPHVDPDIQKYGYGPDKRFVITYSKLTPAVYTRVASSGVLLTMRYLVPPRAKRNSEQIIWEAVLKAFGQHWDIDFAYETQREYLHFREAKRPSQETSPELSQRPKDEA